MPTAKPFPRVFWVALALEMLERLAFYGVYVNLAVYLTGTVGFSDVENGSLLGVFALVRSWVPVATGGLADRIGFRRSLAIAFLLYILAYGLLFLAPSRAGAWAAVMGMAFGGAFLKPVIPGTVRRYAPEDRRPMGFSLFYASVNAGSVVGKVATKIVRELLSLRASMVNAIVACAIGLAVTLGAFREPEAAPIEPTKAPEVANYRSILLSEGNRAASQLKSLKSALPPGELIVFLLMISGYYLLIEQFYQTFPIYIVRSFGEKAPREYITLINPISIAVFQVLVARVMKRLPSLYSIAIGVLIASTSMLLMGSVPSLRGACLSFFVFAIAEMMLAPRYYEYISSFAPKGREGLYMGFALVPVGLGGLAGGVLSGRLVARYLPKEGPRDPLAVWGTYAAIGVFCAAMLGVYAVMISRRRAREEIAAQPV